MTLQDEIAALRTRIATAESERDAWRASGRQEKYLEAYSLVAALELRLERLREEGVRSFARNNVPAEVPVPAASPGKPRSGRERLMAELAIAYDGRRYHYDAYRYDHLADAVEYAKLERSRPGIRAPRPAPPVQAVAEPDAAQRRLMASLAIVFRDGVYQLGTYRYDRLSDAVNYARLQPPAE